MTCQGPRGALAPPSPPAAIHQKICWGHPKIPCPPKSKLETEIGVGAASPPLPPLWEPRSWHPAPGNPIKLKITGQCSLLTLALDLGSGCEHLIIQLKKEKARGGRISCKFPLVLSGGENSPFHWGVQLPGSNPHLFYLPDLPRLCSVTHLPHPLLYLCLCYFGFGLGTTHGNAQSSLLALCSWQGSEGAGDLIRVGPSKIVTSLLYYGSGQAPHQVP